MKSKEILLRAICLCLPLVPHARADDTAWPVAGSAAKPWTRWWWLGSGVDHPNLTRELEAFAKAGIGGVEICPIYGAKGYEKRDIPFLSETWTTAYSHAANEARRLGMGIDLTTGTGWPFGGPAVAAGTASASLETIIANPQGGRQFEMNVPNGRVLALQAWNADSTATIDLTGLVKDGHLQWTPPAGQWNIHGLSARHGIQKVKRAAPGGAGFVLDPYSTKAMETYLTGFETALDRPGVPEPRSHFHDSYEYYQAGWTPELFKRFAEMCGYDLRSQLAAFQGNGAPATVARVRADYRRTMSELHREYLSTWHDWANDRGSLTRNQAHGSPGNLLDHYAVADIPETETFGHVDHRQIPMLQFAASAARTSGRKLVSAESFTWLDEHFQVTPKMLKGAADFLWLCGANHLFFHGIPYSPEDAPWPGWLFYASTHMGPNGGLWENLPAFNTYITRVQSVLQEGVPDSPALVYFPVHDLWQDGSEGLPLFTMHNPDQWLYPTAFYKVAQGLLDRGVPADFVSDRMLAQADVAEGSILLGGRKHQLLIIPETNHLPLETARHLMRLSSQGGKIRFIGTPPDDVPGFYRHETRRAELVKLLAPAARMIAKTLDECLDSSGISRETMVGDGLRFVRVARADGWNYFIVNRSDKDFDGMIQLAKKHQSAVMLDPMSGRSGVVETDGGVRLILKPGQSIVLRTFDKKIATGEPWRHHQPAGDAIPLAGSWQVRFLHGGPEIPAGYQTESLNSWTTRGVREASFSGTARYRLEFALDQPLSALLDLGEIAHTAKVRLNGRDLGTCWSPPHVMDATGYLTSGTNLLEVEVTNLAANRIADLDRRKVPWKAFHEINFVNKDYLSFDASSWLPMPSGLLGPVRLIPVR